MDTETIAQCMDRLGLVLATKRPSQDLTERLDNEVYQVREAEDGVEIYDQPGFFVWAVYPNAE